MLTLTDLYVLASRVQRGDRLYVIGFDPSKESDHLRKLRHSAMLGIWRGGYDDATGRWSAPRAARVAAGMSASKSKTAAAARAVKRAAPTTAATHAPKAPRTVNFARG